MRCAAPVVGSAVGRRDRVSRWLTRAGRSSCGQRMLDPGAAARGASSISTEPPWAVTRPLTMYMPSPEPPRAPCFQNFVKTRLRMSGLIPSPSSSTCSSTPAYVARRRSSRTRSRAPCPRRAGRALSTRLVTTWANLSGSTMIVGSSSVDVEGDLAAGAGAAPTSTTRLDQQRRTSTGRGKSDSRPVSMRATSRSSAISRVSRSASALTVLEHQLLLVVVELVPRWAAACDEALDAGQRRAQLVGDGGDQVGALAVEPLAAAAGAQRDRRPADTGPVRRAAQQDPGGDQHLGAVGEVPRLLGHARCGW